MTVQQEKTDWLERATELFLRFGIKSITMNDVARDLGISKKTLYQLVESKDDLVVRVLQHHISKEKSECLNLAATAPNAIEEIFIIMETNTRELTRMRTNIVHDLQKYHHTGFNLLRKFHHDFVFKVVRENLIRGREEGLYRDNFDIDIIAKLHLATAFNLFDPQLFPVEATARVTLFHEFMKHYLYGIASAKGLTYLNKKLS